jgi:hypothetical protein
MDEAGAVGCGAIDWSQPWFSPWHEPGDRVARRVAAGLPLHEALNRQGGAPVRFVAQAQLPAGVPYEAHIFEGGTCPTRDNLHDFFNGLCWIAMPLAKRRLNALQAAQIAAAGVGGVRGPVRDAITIFDENGALLEAPPALWQALLAREWRRLFVDLRPLWREARLLVFGHALLEKLVHPRKDLTAHVWAIAGASGGLQDLDGWLAQQLTAERLAAKPFTPLPLLGVPGWCPENQNFSFYDDSLVFRTAGHKNLKTTAPTANSRS